MADEIIVNAEPRTESGSTAARRLRRSGNIPAVLANTKGESKLLKLNAHDFERTMSKHTALQLVVTINCEGKSTKALLREIQRDSLTGYITHADFGEIDATHKMHITVPVVLVGTPEGVATQGGILDQVRHELEISCLPADVIEELPIDVSSLKVGEDIKVADIKLDEKYAILTNADVVVAAVVAPEGEAEAAPAEAEA